MSKKKKPLKYWPRTEGATTFVLGGLEFELASMTHPSGEILGYVIQPVEDKESK